MKEIVDKYVITKHYHQLMPLSLATNKSKKPRKQTMDTYEVKWPMGYALGYASGKILKISKH
ncbi:hypothetical protein T06_8491 [Trichinella sp. T6]|nr:hypothetical protein T06_8491 [Trichinella sp. T6]